MATATASAPKRSTPTTGRRDEFEVVKQRGRKLRIGIVVAAILATGILFGLVAFQAIIVTNQTTLDDLDARISQAERQNARLRLEVAELEAPDRIRAMALALGMEKPESVAYLEPIDVAELGEPLVPAVEDEGEVQ